MLKRTRVLLADGRPAMLRRLTRLLEPNFEVVAAVTEAEAVVELEPVLCPGVIVMELTTRLVDTLESIRKLRGAGSEARIVLIGLHLDPDLVVQICLEHGACAYVHEPRLGVDLHPAMQAALAGEKFLSSTLKHRRALHADPP